MQKKDCFPEKEDKKMFAYVLEFMLTLAKMQDNSTLFCAPVDCNHHAMTALFEYSISLVWYWHQSKEEGKYKESIDQVRFPHLTQGTVLESDKNTRKKSHTRELRGQLFLNR